MSIKQMTVEQIQDDLESIVQTWPGGIPPEQTDRVNALKNALKQRGVEVRAARPQANKERPRSIASMTEEQLEQELRTLSKDVSLDPKDEDLQNRFADVRFEMRKRAKAEPSSPPVSPRAIEIPDQVEVDPKSRLGYPCTCTKAGANRDPNCVVHGDQAGSPPGQPGSGGNERSPFDKTKSYTEDEQTSPSSEVKGFTALTGGGSVILKYTGQDFHRNIIQVASKLSINEAESLIGQLQKSVDEARRAR